MAGRLCCITGPAALADGGERTPPLAIRVPSTVSSSTLLALAAAIILAGVGVRAATGRERAVPATVGDVRPGLPAPDFTLQASDGRTYTLSQFTGRQAVVIAWFPKAFTGG
jgi:hypothetical protein